MFSSTASKAVASATIEPIGLPKTTPREHSISVILRLSTGDARHADKDHVESVVRKALAGFPPAGGALDRRRFEQLSVTRKSSKAGAAARVVVGVEGTAIWPGRPGNDSVESLRKVLLDDGYRVAVREKRECAEPACHVYAMVDWSNLSEVPPGWHTHLVCGAHNYRTCSRCKSTYSLTSVNAAGQAPSVHCEVCGQVIIEWGSSKIWTAQLMTKGLIPARG